MELLIGSIVTLIVQVMKKVSNKYGVEMTKSGILIAVFVCVFAGTVVVQAHLISAETISFLLKAYAAAIATYEIVVKRVILPILAKLSGQA